MGKFVLAVSVILCTVLLGVAIAQEKPEPKQEPKQPKTEQPAKATKAYAGEVVSVDATKNEIVIKDEAGAETKLLVDKSTKITKEGKAISLADVKGGDKVTSDCEASGDGCKAKAVQVTTPPQG